MELSEQERRMLTEKKDEIRKLTEEIIDLEIDTKKNASEIKKKVTGILSLISIIASYSKSKNYDLEAINDMGKLMFLQLNRRYPPLATLFLELFCNTVNAIQFDFTKRDVKINIPKIDVSIFRKG